MILKTNFGALAIIISLLFTSCKKDFEENQKTETITDTAAILVDSVVIAEDDTLISTEKAFQNLGIYKIEALEKLKNATKEEGNTVFNEYEKKCDKIIVFLNQSEGEALEDYASYYDHEKNEYVFPDGVKIQVKQAAKSDIEFWDVGEGYAEIRFKPYHYYTIFKGKVTADYDYYLRTKAKEDAVLYSADAGLLIDFKDLGDRVLSWEYFMDKYPNSPLYSKALKRYQEYGHFYLFGMDNTSTFEYADMTMYPENREEFNRFITKNPKSNYARIVKSFVEKFDNKMSFEDLKSVTNKELKIKEDFPE